MGFESHLSTVVADGMINSKHNRNKELIGQGIVNIVTPLFLGIARTATNIKSGALLFMGGFVLFSLLILLLKD